MYIHKSIDYGINIRRKKANNTQTYTMTYKKKKIKCFKLSMELTLPRVLLCILYAYLVYSDRYM